MQAGWNIIWYVDKIVNTGTDEDEASWDWDQFHAIGGVQEAVSLAIPRGQDTGVGSSSVMCIIQESPWTV